MNLNLLRKFILIGMVAVAGQGWATVSLPPAHGSAAWNDISSIVWSTDNGATWGNSTLTVGQTVQFQVTLHKSYDGRHYADFVKTWVDWSGDGSFSASEAILFSKHIVNGAPVTKASDLYVDQSFAYKSSGITLTNAMLGNHYLLARVTCSESLLQSTGNNTWNDQWLKSDAWYDSNFLPLAYYYQGESETRLLSVNGQKVPEPGTLALFAAGVAGLGFGRKRRIEG